jgi:putative transposase
MAGPPGGWCASSAWVDAYTRECLALEADTSLGSGRVTRVLERLIEERSRPENVRSDNGPRFTSRRMLGQGEDWKVGLGHIQPERPMQNGHVERLPREAARRMPQRALVPHAE